MAYVITTVSGTTYLKDLGYRNGIVHPTSIDLSALGFTLEEIDRSINLQEALIAGTITATNNGNAVVAGVSVTPAAAGTLTGATLAAGVTASSLTSFGSSPALTTPSISGGTHTGITGLGIRSTGSGAFDLTIANAENLTSARTLTVSVTDGNRLLRVSGDSIISGANTGDQTIILTGDVTGSGTGSFTTTLATVTAAKGGTGQTTYTVGDILYASASTTLSKLSGVASGSYLRSGGVSTAPVWSTLTLPNAATTGDLLQASASNTISSLTAVATGNALISGGVGTASSWGKIGLTTHVSGILPVVNGGTGASTALGSFNAISPLTTKGDLIGRDSTNNIRIPVGTNNQYLIADSSQASGLLWAGIDRDFQTVSTLNSTSTQTAPNTTTFYACPGSLSLTTTGRAAKAYQISFTGMFSINSSVDRLTTFRFIVDGVAQTAYDTQVFTTDNNRQTQISRIFTLPSIAPSVVISMQYSVNTTNSTVLRLFSANLSIVGVG